MLKYFTIFLLFISMLEAKETIKFQEDKYIDILQQSQSKKGELTFDNETITLKYKNSSRKLIYKNDTLKIETKDDTQIIDLNNQFTLKMIFLLIKSIHYNQVNLLDDFFYLKIVKGVSNLSPKGSVGNYIEHISFKKTNNKLQFIEILMTNKNKTTIKHYD